MKNKYFDRSDEQLMELVVRKDTTAFDELYHRYSKKLLHYFFRMLGGSEEKAQDFLQELFLKLVEKPHLFRTDARFSTWIFSVAHNMCKNEYRRQRVRRVIDQDIDIETVTSSRAQNESSIEREFIQREFTEELLHELNKLDAIKRSVFLLRYREHLSLKEMSEVLGCSIGTVKSRLFYTTKELAARLSAYKPDHSEV